MTGTGCNLLYTHFRRTGQRDKLRPLEHRVDEFKKLNALARQERALISTKDSFLPPALTPQQMTDLCKVFSGEPVIGSAAVVQKRLVHFSANPYFVVGLKIKVPW